MFSLPDQCSVSAFWTAEKPRLGVRYPYCGFTKSPVFKINGNDVYLNLEECYWSIGIPTYLIKPDEKGALLLNGMDISVHMLDKKGSPIPALSSNCICYNSRSLEHRVHENPCPIWKFRPSSIQTYFPNFRHNTKFRFRFEIIFLKGTEDYSFQLKPYVPQGVKRKQISIEGYNAVPGLESLSNDLSKLLNDSSKADVMLTCADQTVKVHSLILNARSDVFAAMLRNDTLERQTGRINVREMDPGIFPDFVRYLYTGALPDQLSVDSARFLYEAGDRHAMKALMKQCSSILEGKLDAQNVCEILVLADKHSDHDLKEKAVVFILKEGILPMNTKWVDFSKCYPLLANDVMIRYFMQEKNETIS